MVFSILFQHLQGVDFQTFTVNYLQIYQAELS